MLIVFIIIQLTFEVYFNFNTFSFILVLQNNFSHSTLLNRVNCEKQILPSMGFEPTTSCICGKRLTARPRGPHGRERTTSRLILKHLEITFEVLW